MLKLTEQMEAVRAAKEELGDATNEELSAYIREAFGLTIQPFIVAVLIGTGKEREHLDRVNEEVRGRLEGWKAENKRLAATAKRREAARRRKAGAAEVSPPVTPDMIPVVEAPADAGAANDANAEDAERDFQAGIARDIFGNPFRPAAWDASRATAEAIAFARTIYEEQAFVRMPELADALSEAGCRNDEILDHCRRPGEHVRGCWVVDLILGKK